MKNAAARKDKGYRVLFGEGVTSWRDLLAAAESVGGVEVFLIEQEGSRFPEFQTAERCLETGRLFRRYKAYRDIVARALLNERIEYACNNRRTQPRTGSPQVQAITAHFETLVRPSA